MSLTSVKRTFRKADWLVRFVVISVICFCSVTVLTWAWAYGRAIYSARIERETTNPVPSVLEEAESVEDQPITCPPCPETFIPEYKLLATAEAPPPSELHAINCTINHQDVIECMRDKDEVYLPASFVNNYFEVYGSIKTKGNEEFYEFQHAYGKLLPPQPVYHPGGVFLNFDKYYVEGRAAIMCITASDGVPLVKQWDPEGYYYAISVAQYGLSHHAKGILDGNPVHKVLASGQTDLNDWKVTGAEMSIHTTLTKLGVETKQVLAFNSPASLMAPGPTLELNRKEQALCMDILMKGPGGITVKIKTKEGKLGYVHFDHEDRYMAVNDSHVVYGMGRKNLGRWLHLARDVHVDWMKSLQPVKYNAPTQFLEIVSVALHGNGLLDNLTIGATAHNDHLMHAANWLVANQDTMGGWPTSIGMKTGLGIELKPGWYSAMGQGQAMSTLVRAYNLTGQPHYLDVAIRGLRLFELGSEEGGVRARFLGLLDWYEEYPTTPTSSFVLNGFIFSMLGLYDVMKTAEGDGQRLAEKLWNSGLKSLKTMLGMYDSGTGTLYDLRHVVCHEQPNRARWDYHTVHITLIQQMAIIDGDPMFHTTAERWIQYYYGKPSRHN